ncbi:hypothetical protein K2F45_25945 [Sphingobacterium siyangense]|uniref:HTH cro/C1-type domain-containing protein n=1 Tax=Sphingobacterium multivorum TaxID=28454 RepID=A0ABX7CPB8_SPHMU|nr:MULTISPECIES: hypothetical protein [Sphingobacterium]QQT30448.1 hypothetical protein I6I99_24635 [Sphingobacterium multivorum]QQT53574.1 hypothetical protein I6I98_25665 [Sphingobacterium multivorum]UQA75166.1 hypothetical protein K2F45_25945 [Sphingobacterium siyangense]
MNVKERVLLIAETKGISKTEFFKDVQLSYANFKGGQKNTALSSDAMVAILSKHPDISPAWLLMGEGTMMRKDERNVVSAPPAETAPATAEGLGIYRQLVNALEQTVKAQEKTIQSLEGQVSLLQRK